MEWFFAFDENATEWFSDMIKVAVISANRCTNLKPHCLYDGKPNALTDWLTSNGVKVHFHQVPFKGELSSPLVIERNKGGYYTPSHAAGAFLRVEAARFATSETFLYTDCDVMFLRDVPATIEKIGAVAEPKGGFNSGVLLINREFFLRQYAPLIEHFRQHNFYDLAHLSFDQALLNTFFVNDWTKLPPSLNWRPWMGVNPEAAIVHFHGPKPTRARAILEGRGLAEEAALLAYLERDADAYRHYVSLFETFLSAKTCRRLFRGFRPWRGLNSIRNPDKVGVN